MTTGKNTPRAVPLAERVCLETRFDGHPAESSCAPVLEHTTS